MVLPEILRGNDALQRVTAFARKYGPAHITLAMHASLPLGLTPEMLHLIRVNFASNAPWIAEADVLLSPLCREVGGELYEMLPETRELLLDELKTCREFGIARVKEVAEFVYEYSARALRMGDTPARGEMRDFYQAQQWVALAYTRPEEAAQSLALALKEGLQAENQAEAIRVARLAQGLAAPLLSQERILLYSAGVEKLAADEPQSARNFFEAIGPLDQAVSISGVELPSPDSILPAPPAPTIIDSPAPAIIDDRVKQHWEPASRSRFNETDWRFLLRTIQMGRCTPVIGPGALAGVLPLGSQIAQQWADMYGYPFEDSHNLARVARFLSVQQDPLFPKVKLAQLLREYPRPNYAERESMQGVLARLPLPVYLSTTYDDFMEDALSLMASKDPRFEFCRWNELLERNESFFDSEMPTRERPLVFHFFGHQKNPESLVLTEDDYLDFVFNVSRNHRLIPPRVEQALTDSLLFVGIDWSDFGMRALLKTFSHYTERSLGRGNFIQINLPYEIYGERAEFIQRYLERYFANMRIKVYWGTPAEFAAELHYRWENDTASL